MLIYNYSSTVEAPVSYGKMIDTSIQYLNERRKRYTFKYYLYSTKYKWLFTFYTIVLHWIPALFIDTILYCTGKNPRLKKNMF